MKVSTYKALGALYGLIAGVLTHFHIYDIAIAISIVGISHMLDIVAFTASNNLVVLSKAINEKLSVREEL